MSSDEYKEFEEIFGDAGFGDSSFGDSGFGSSGFGNSGFESADIFMWISIVLFAIVFTVPPFNLEKMSANGKWMFAAWVTILAIISVEKLVGFFRKPIMKAD